jgi:hypothetical protein
MEFYIGLVIFIIIIIGWGMTNAAQAREQERTHEKVMELIKEGHDAEVCPKCKGRRMAGWGQCSQCGGLGYSYKLHKEKLRKKDGQE